MTDRIPSPYSDSRFRQQDLPASRPFLTPKVGSIMCAIVAVISGVFGTSAWVLNNRIFSATIQYEECEGGRFCNVSLIVPENVTGPLYIFYSLTNFYQSTYLYSASKSWPQLRGQPYKDGDVSTCAPRIRDESDRIYLPCGLVPRSVFNDTFTFPHDFPEINENDTAQSRFQNLFQELDPSYDSVGADKPNPTIFPLGQTDDRFVTWMDIAPFPKFQKLWGETKPGVVLEAGEYEIRIENNYPVSSFEGTKSLIISQVIWTGGPNPSFGYAFIVITIVAALAAIVFFVAYKKRLFRVYRIFESRYASGPGQGHGVLNAELIGP
jgi:hypothetical protein